MSQVRDIFFDEFYKELESLTTDLKDDVRESEQEPILFDDLRGNWIPHVSRKEDWDEVLVSVDGGVQVSQFAYGDFVAVGRACALIHWPERKRDLDKRVKIYIDKVYDNRDKGYIPRYVRTISEYEVAKIAAERVLDQGCKPLVLLDGSLYLSRFPYAMREYLHHPDLLTELFNSMSDLHYLSRDRGFPLVAVTKDSTVFYLYMELLKNLVRRAGNSKLYDLIENSSSPLDLRIKAQKLNPNEKEEIQPFIEEPPLCDTDLIYTLIEEEGFSRPLLLAPSIYYRGGEASTLIHQIERNIEGVEVEIIVNALKNFFNTPRVAVTYWKPNRQARPFRIDLSAASLGHKEPWEGGKGNILVGNECDLKPIMGILNHLGHWFCNEVEYNIPLRQADTLARFDRELYRNMYEPFIVNRLEQVGLRVKGRRRALRMVE